MTVADPNDETRGRTVVDRHGEEIGKVNDLVPVDVVGLRAVLGAGLDLPSLSGAARLSPFVAGLSRRAAMRWRRSVQHDVPDVDP